MMKIGGNTFLDTPESNAKKLFFCYFFDTQCMSHGYSVTVVHEMGHPSGKKLELSQNSEMIYEGISEVQLRSNWFD